MNKIYFFLLCITIGFGVEFFVFKKGICISFSVQRSDTVQKSEKLILLYLVLKYLWLYSYVLSGFSVF